MLIDNETLENALKELVTKYRDERERTKSVKRTIAKAKQEAILEVLDIVAGMETAADKSATEAANPWRYFRRIDDINMIRRVRQNEVGAVFYLDGSRSRGDYLRWYLERPLTFLEITESEAVEILGGKRPWGTEKQSPETSAAVALLRESKQFCGTKTAEMIDQAIAMLVGGGEC